jgi:hypothetical protein
MNAGVLLKRVKDLKAKHFIETDNEVESVEEMLRCDAIIEAALKPFPEAKVTLAKVLKQFEQEEQHSKSTILRLKRPKVLKGVYVESREQRISHLVSKALSPWPEAKWALAEALVECAETRA